MLFRYQLAKCHGEGGSLICKPDSQDTAVLETLSPPSPLPAAENYEGGGQLGFSLGAPRLDPWAVICTHLPFAASTLQPIGVFQSLSWGKAAQARRRASWFGTAELKHKCNGEI